MNKAGNDFDLISQMVNETFKHTDCDETEIRSSISSEKSDLQHLSSPQKTVQLEFHFNSFLGAYDAEKQCFVFQVEDQVLEFPKNWGPFAMSVYEQGQVETLFDLQYENDIYCLIDIFSEILSKPLKSLKLVNQGNFLSLDYEQEEFTSDAKVIPLYPNHLSIAS